MTYGVHHDRFEFEDGMGTSTPDKNNCPIECFPSAAGGPWVFYIEQPAALVTSWAIISQLVMVRTVRASIAKCGGRDKVSFLLSEHSCQPFLIPTPERLPTC